MRAGNVGIAVVFILLNASPPVPAVALPSPQGRSNTAAPQAAGSELQQLRQEVARFRAVVCDPATDPEVRALNQRRIARRRAVMAPLLEQAISAVKADTARAGLLRAEDKADADHTLLRLQDELDEARSATVMECSGPAMAAAAASAGDSGSQEAAHNGHRAQVAPPPAPAAVAVTQSDPTPGAQAASDPPPPPRPPEQNPATTAPASPLASATNVVLSPSEINFPRQPWATESNPETVTVTNTTERTAALPPQSYSPDFKIRANTCGNVLEAHASCNFKVTYTPFGSRPESTHLVLLNQADLPNFPQLVAMRDAASRVFELAVQDEQATRQQVESAQEEVDVLRQQVSSAQQEVNAAERKLTSARSEAAKAPGQAKLQEAQQKAEARAEQSREALETAKAALAQKETVLAAAKAALIPKLEAMQNAQEEMQKQQEALLKASAKAPGVKLTGTPEHWKYPLTRAVVGIDLSAPSSQAIKQDYFVEFDLLAPIRLSSLKRKNEDPLENRWWFWLNPRITSLPQATNFSALSTINEGGAFFNNFAQSADVSKLAQGLDVGGGIEYALFKPRDGIPWWAEYPNTLARLSPSLIAGGGFTTPFSTDKTDVTSKVNQSICDAFNKGLAKPSFTCVIPTGGTSPVIQDFTTGTNKSFITFVTPDRSRFFKKFFVGMRLKTFYFSKDVKADCYPRPRRIAERGDCEAPYSIFPGIIDLTAGKDEAVTAGHLSKWLFRADAVYPLPFYQGIHVFGSVYSALGKSRSEPPFNAYTVDAPAAGTNNDANTFRFLLPAPNRDYFRIGIGVDLVQLFKKAAGGGQPDSKAPTPSPDTKGAGAKPAAGGP